MNVKFIYEKKLNMFSGSKWTSETQRLVARRFMQLFKFFVDL